MGLEVELPNTGSTNHYLLDPNHIAFVYVNHDECVPNPLEECDGYGMIQSFCTRHVNFCHPDEIEDDDDRVALSYFEHGACRWGVAGTMGNMPDFMWDGVEIAGVWYPDDCVREVADSRQLKGTVRRAWMKKQAESACKVYTAWCNGYVYFTRVTVYKIRRTEDGICYNREDDYRFDEALFDEGCGGFFDQESLVEFVEDNLKWVVEKLEIQLPVEVKS